MLARFEKLLAHVDEIDARHRAVTNAGKQFEKLVFPQLRVVAAFKTGRCGTEHHASTGVLRAHHGDIAAVIARILFLLVALIVLFIDNDEAQIANGREHAGARPHDYAGRAGTNFSPLAGAFGVAESAVQNCDAVAKPGEELSGHGGR